MIYEYKCKKCGTITEVEWKNRDTIPSYATCTSCGTRSPRKFSSFSFSFSPYLMGIEEGK